jgi:hypothetical protein
MRYLAYCLALAAVLSTSCRPTSPPATPNPSPDAGIPTSLRGYRMTASDTIAEKDGGGKLYRFNDGSAAYITVFVYPVPPDVKVATDSAQWVVIEGEKFARVLPIFVQRGRYDAFEMAFANPEPVVVELDTIPGFAAAVTRSKGEVSVQLQYLYLVRGQFLKVRATLPQDQWQQAPVPLFAQDLVRAMTSHH